MKALIKIIFILFITQIIHLSCASQEKHGKSHKVRFIVIGNTSPVSPFTGFPRKLPYVIKSINMDNPTFVIHTGNIIQGGQDWMGINSGDINRQFKNFKSEMKKLNSIIHTAAGEKDTFNGSIKYYLRHTGKKLNYSFNYGNIHFIILNIMSKKHKITTEQIKWLKADLNRHKNYSAIFVFTHYPVMAPFYSGLKFNDGKRLHKIFTAYPVKAVISGGMKRFYETKKDNIKYIIAGCFGYNYEDWHWGSNQYYVVNYNGNMLFFNGKKVSFPPNSYRPKIIKEPSSEKK